ncbi:YdcF family protein [Microvirga sp. P5_D2]
MRVQNRGGLSVARGMVIALGLLVLAVAGILAEIAIYSTRSNAGNADAAIVLGAAVYTDRPSPVFEERIRHGVALYKGGQVQRLVMTGGRGPGDRLSEAEAARDWAVAQGVPPEAIVLEDASRTTQENLSLALPLLRKHGVGRVLIVSDPLHMRRAMVIAERLGIEAQPSPTPTSRYVGWASWFGFLVREGYYLTRCRVTGRC